MALSLNRINAFLLALAALLAVLLWRGTEPSTSAGEPGRLLANLTPEEIDQLTISTADKENITLVRHGDGWQLQTPYTQPASKLKVEALLAMVSAPVYERFTPTGMEHQQFQRDGAEVTVSFADSRFVFGRRSPVGQRRYGFSDGDVVLINDFYFHHANSRWVDWVANRLLSEQSRLTRIELPGLVIHNTQQGWQVQGDQPLELDLDQSQLNALAQRWQHLHTMGAIPLPDGSEFGALPKIRLDWVDSGSGERQELTLFWLEQGGDFGLLCPQRGVAHQLEPELAKQLLPETPTPSP